MILVTAYYNPDLDGTACAYAYSEYLNSTGKKTVAGIFGTPDRESEFVIRRFKIPKIKNAENFIDKSESVILVDASEISGISSRINPSTVSEIIDHRKVNESEKFPNAIIQIEFVGAAATLVAEKFYKNKVKISKESASLLASAIVSNTINFRNKVTTQRDKKMYKWLLSKVKLPKNYIHDMFAYKSKIDKPLKQYFLEDKFAVWEFGGKKTSTLQVEIVDVEKFIKNNEDEITRVMMEIKKERELDALFLTCIDIEKGFNMFFVVDEFSKNIYSTVLKVKFNGNVAKRKGIIMRKEITPLVKEFLES